MGADAPADAPAADWADQSLADVSGRLRQHLADLERVYDALAQTLDRAPQGRRELLLVKLALLLAHAMGDGDEFVRLAEIALQDL